MKTKITKALIFGAMSAALLSGCGGGKGDSTKTTINIYSFEGGNGTKWLENAATRFTELKKETSYQEGKKGVQFSTYFDMNNNVSTMGSDGYQIYFTENSNTTPAMLNAASNLEILNEVVSTPLTEFGETRSIQDKIDSNYLKGITDAQKNVFALPHFEWYPGLTYYKTIFDNECFYFADESAEEVENYDSKAFGKANFIADLEQTKSCGPDGQLGTDDDGLPRTLNELLILCCYMKENGVTPFTVAGSCHSYIGYIVESLVASLVTKEQMEGYYSFDSSMNVVTGYSEDIIFGYTGTNATIKAIKAPVVSESTVTESTGYLTRQTAERYYATAFISIAKELGWFSQVSMNPSYTNYQAQKEFVLSPYKSMYESCGMLIDGNYWYNECKNHTTAFKDLEKYSAKAEFAWFSTPTGALTATTQKTKMNVMDTGYSYCFLNGANKRIPAGELAAAKEFVRFLYSDAELKNFTKETGVRKAAIDYDYLAADITKEISPYQASVLKMTKENNVVYAAASNKTFQAHTSSFVFGIKSPLLKPTLGGVEYTSYFDALENGYNAKQVFEASHITPQKWASDYYVSK